MGDVLAPSLAVRWNFSCCYLGVANNRAAAFLRLAALTRLKTSREVGVGSPFDSLNQLLEPSFRQPPSLPSVKDLYRLSGRSEYSSLLGCAGGINARASFTKKAVC